MKKVYFTEEEKYFLHSIFMNEKPSELENVLDVYKGHPSKDGSADIINDISRKIKVLNEDDIIELAEELLKEYGDLQIAYTE